MKASELDKKFDKGEDILEFLDLARAKRRGQVRKRVNMDFPLWTINRPDRKEGDKVHTGCCPNKS